MYATSLAQPYHTDSADIVGARSPAVAAPSLNKFLPTPISLPGCEAGPLSRQPEKASDRAKPVTASPLAAASGYKSSPFTIRFFSFFEMLAGLLCLRSAREGGVSSWSSSVVHPQRAAPTGAGRPGRRAGRRLVGRPQVGDPGRQAALLQPAHLQLPPGGFFFRGTRSMKTGFAGRARARR